MSVARTLASVLVSNRNYGEFLRAAIDSALSQTYGALEIIVVDDGSDDDSAEIISGYGERVTAIFMTESRGQGAAINAGFRASTGELIFLLDADDEFVPEKVARVMELYALRPEIQSCFHAVQPRENGNTLPWTRLEPAGQGDYRSTVEWGRMPTISTPTVGCSFRRGLFERMLPLPEVPGVVSNDIYLKWCALALGPTYFLDEPLSVQRLHGSNLYSLQNDKRLRARVRLLAVQTMRRRFPQTARFADAQLARSVAALHRNGGLDDEGRSLVREYLEGLSPRERRKVRLAVLVARLPAPVREAVYALRRSRLRARGR